MEALLGTLGALVGALGAFFAYRFHGFRAEALLDLERARKRITELDAQVLRTAEDRDTTVTRIQGKALEDKKFAHRDLAFELLEVVDNLERSLAHSDTEGFTQGVRMIEQQLGATLRRNGIQPIDALGLVFDPAKHEVVETEESIEAEDTVLREWLRGYTINGRILRASKVVLAVPLGSKVEEAEEVPEEAPAEDPAPLAEDEAPDEAAPEEEAPDEEPPEEPPQEEAPDEEQPAEEPELEEAPDEEPPEEAPELEEAAEEEEAPDEDGDDSPVVVVQDSSDAVEHIVTLDRPLMELAEEDLDSTEVVQEDILDEITEDLPMVKLEIEEE